MARRERNGFLQKPLFQALSFIHFGYTTDVNKVLMDLKAALPSGWNNITTSFLNTQTMKLS